jgi:hypothetical protein
MEQPMKKHRIPLTDSIEKLARFWESHDVTDFDEELVEVRRPVFTRRRSAVMTVRLSPKEADVVRRLARSRGVGRSSLIQQWVREKLRKEAATRPA